MMTLSMVQNGDHVEIVRILGGCKVQQRLEAMGFVPGVVVQLITRPIDGPAIVKVKDTRIALGGCMLHQIMVQPFGDGRCQKIIQRRVHPGRHRKRGHHPRKIFKY